MTTAQVRNGRYVYTRKTRSAGMLEVCQAIHLETLGEQLVPPVSRQAVSSWDEVPARYVVQVERLTSIPREKLRPDLYE